METSADLKQVLEGAKDRLSIYHPVDGFVVQTVAVEARRKFILQLDIEGRVSRQAGASRLSSREL